MATFSVKNFSFTYPQHTQPALKELDFTIEAGQFIALGGHSGCGKTTLLRQLKSALAPHGASSGEILFNRKPLQDIPWQEQAAQIGFVQQCPDYQIVTDKVWHELAFGLENLGADNSTIRLRVAEMAAFFGIESWFHQSIDQLSGGQKQLLNLAAVMTMQPAILLLDEPTSQLDPIAAQDFLETLTKINRELGTTILLCEHRLEEVLPLSDRLILLEAGKIIVDDEPKQAAFSLLNTNKMFNAMPTAVKVWANVANPYPCPLTVREGRQWLDTITQQHSLDDTFLTAADSSSTKETIISLNELSFAYQKEAPLVLNNLSLDIRQGEIFALVGGNGSGKSTLLSLIAGIKKPQRGKIAIAKELFDDPASHIQQLALLPQKPQTLFVKNTLIDDLYEVFEGRNISATEQDERVKAVSRLCELADLWPYHPFDLSGGEQQRAALAKILLLAPRILLLDEPTKGLDSVFKEKLAGILHTLQEEGVTILIVSHDIEFCARYAERCGLLFDGAIVASEQTRAFFAGQYFYTTAASRIARQLLPSAILADDIIKACNGDTVSPDQKPRNEGKQNLDVIRLLTPPKSDAQTPIPTAPVKKQEAGPIHMTAKRRNIGIALIILFIITAVLGFDRWVDWRLYLYWVVLALEAAFALIAFFPGALLSHSNSHAPVITDKIEKSPSWRNYLIILIVFLGIPLTIWLGIAFLEDRQYYFISLLVIIEAMIPFILIFEGRKPQARELVMIAVLIAIAVAGRTALFMVPQFKPVLAIIIITGIALGKETGFLVGAMTAFISNFFLGQGPWTPWQMFAFGLIGFISGALFYRGLLPAYRSVLLVFGALATFIIYGGIMNGSSLVLFVPEPSWGSFLSIYALGLPFDIVHTIATVFFLGVAAAPLLDKIERVRQKYGLLA